jgi:hypothetical protein
MSYFLIQKAHDKAGLSTAPDNQADSIFVVPDLLNEGGTYGRISG